MAMRRHADLTACLSLLFSPVFASWPSQPYCRCSVAPC